MIDTRGLLSAVVLFSVILSGCGSPPPPPPTAEKDIDSARQSLESARAKEKMGQLDMALGELRQAKEAISRGKDYAEGTELALLSTMEDDTRKQITAIEMKKINLAAQPEKPKPIAAAPGKKSEDPEEKKQRLADAEEAKRKADVAKTSAKLDANFGKGTAVAKGKDKPQDDDDAAPAVKKGDKPGAKDGEEEAAAETKGKPAKPANGPFPAISEQSPDLEVVKLTVKGKFAIGYFQLYNKTDNGKRIMNVAVYFKNGNGQEVMDARAVAVFPYKGFKADVANPTNQQLDGITSGSHQITGMEGMQFAAVGEHDKASEVKSVGVIIVYDDGTKVSAAGPANGVDGGGVLNKLKGL